MNKIDRWLDQFAKECISWTQARYRTRAGTISGACRAGKLSPAALAAEVIGSLSERARSEMEIDARYRRDGAFRANIQSVPVYARLAIFADALPPCLLAQAQRHEGAPIDSAVVGRKATAVADFGRARNITGAMNNPRDYASPGVRSIETVSHGRYSSRCSYTRYSYHATYCCVANRAGTRMYICLPDGRRAEAAVARGSWICRALGLREVANQRARGTPALTEAQRVRVVRRALTRRGIAQHYTVRGGMLDLCIEELATGDLYHHNDPRHIIARALMSFALRERDRSQNARNKRIRDYVAEHSDSIWVSVADSLAAGNCEAGTRAALPAILASLNPVGDVGAVTAAHLLSVRDDSATRRAVAVAALRAGA